MKRKSAFALIGPLESSGVSPLEGHATDQNGKWSSEERPVVPIGSTGVFARRRVDTLRTAVSLHAASPKRRSV
jgi:hypothetical protein